MRAQSLLEMPVSNGCAKEVCQASFGLLAALHCPACHSLTGWEPHMAWLLSVAAGPILTYLFPPCAPAKSSGASPAPA